MTTDVEDWGIDWAGANDLALQFEGADLISVNEIDPATGTARVVVWASTASDAPILFEGVVDIALHDKPEPPDEPPCVDDYGRNGTPLDQEDT